MNAEDFFAKILGVFIYYIFIFHKFFRQIIKTIYWDKTTKYIPIIRELRLIV